MAEITLTPIDEAPVTAENLSREITREEIVYDFENDYDRAPTEGEIDEMFEGIRRLRLVNIAWHAKLYEELGRDPALKEFYGPGLVVTPTKETVLSKLIPRRKP